MTSAQSRTIALGDGRTLTLRRLRPDDLDALRRAFRRLTPDEVELRFLYQSRELPASIEREVRELDPERNVAFVLEDAAGEIRGVADLHVDAADAGIAEFGLIVGRAIAGHGLGRRLLARLLAEARERGLTLRGLVLRSNARMLELCKALGGKFTRVPDDPTLVVVGFPA